MSDTPLTDAYYGDRDVFVSTQEDEDRDFARRLERERAELIKALWLTSHKCEHVHHAKLDQHEFDQDCPIEKRIETLLAKVKP